jgi:hypothetical protein
VLAWYQHQRSYRCPGLEQGAYIGGAHFGAGLTIDSAAGMSR